MGFKPMPRFFVSVAVGVSSVPSEVPAVEGIHDFAVFVVNPDPHSVGWKDTPACPVVKGWRGNV